MRRLLSEFRQFWPMFLAGLIISFLLFGIRPECGHHSAYHLFNLVTKGDRHP